MIQGVVILFGMNACNLIRDVLKVWLQKQAEEEENGR